MDILATSRTLSLRPSEAKAAMQCCVEGEVRLDLPAGARAVLHVAPLQGASAAQRSLLVGTIRSRRGWVSVPVEVETAPVSATSSELVVRPVGPVCLRSTSHRRLFDRGSHALADFFRMEIELAGLAPAPATGAVRTAPAAPVPATVSLAV
jgi:hypothetical protein